MVRTPSEHVTFLEFPAFIAKWVTKLKSVFLSSWNNLTSHRNILNRFNVPGIVHFRKKIKRWVITGSWDKCERRVARLLEEPSPPRLTCTSPLLSRADVFVPLAGFAVKMEWTTCGTRFPIWQRGCASTRTSTTTRSWSARWDCC